MDNCISKKDRRRQSQPPPPPPPPPANGLIVRKMCLGSTYSGMQSPVAEDTAGVNDACSISHILSVHSATLEEFLLVELAEKDDMC